MSMTIEDCNSNDNQNLQIKYKLETPIGQVVNFFRLTEKNRSCILRSWIATMYLPRYLESVNADTEKINNAYLEAICFHQREIEKLRFQIAQPPTATLVAPAAPEKLSVPQYFSSNRINKLSKKSNNENY